MREVDIKYILHVWKDGAGATAWRASLKELRSEQVVYFSEPDKLVRFIRQPTELPND